MKFFTVKTLLQYFSPATLTLFMLVTMKRMVVTDGAYDSLFGFPLPYISSNYAFSFHYDVYILRMLFDLLVYFTGTLFFFKLLERYGLKLRTHWTAIALGTILSLFWILSFALVTQDSSFKMISDIDFTTTGRQLNLSSYP